MGILCPTSHHCHRNGFSPLLATLAPKSVVKIQITVQSILAGER